MKLRIEQDDCYESPRDWDNVGTMVCWHRRYTLGDEQPDCTPDEYKRDLAIQACPKLEDKLLYWENDGYETIREGYEQKGQTWDKAVQLACDEINEIKTTLIDHILDANYIFLPLYLYDHSGITMNTTGFHCPWDSGQVGFIYCSVEKAREEWGEDLEKATDYLRGEVETYDQYLTGDVWGYFIEDEDDNHIDSCWGFYGHDYCEQEGERVLEALRRDEKRGLYPQHEDIAN